MVEQYTPYMNVDDAYEFRDPYRYSIMVLNHLSLLLPSIAFLFIFVSMNPGSKLVLLDLFRCKLSTVSKANTESTTENLSSTDSNENPVKKPKSEKETYVSYSRYSVDLRVSDKESYNDFDDDDLIKLANESRPESFIERMTQYSRQVELNPMV